VTDSHTPGLPATQRGAPVTELRNRRCAN